MHKTEISAGSASYEYWRAEYAPLMPQALLLQLAALTSRCGRAVSARTVGNGQLATEIGLDLEAMLGNSATYANAVTVSGLLTLSGKPLVHTFIYDGMKIEGMAHTLLERLIQRKPVRVLDAPENGRKRTRRIDHCIAVILLGYPTAERPDTLTNLLTVRLDARGSALQQQATRNLANFTGQGPALRSRREKTRTALASRISRIAWTCPVRFDDVAHNPALLGNFGDALRYEQLLALTTVWVLLSQEPDDLCPIAAKPKDIEFVVGLLMEAKVDDERHRLSPGAMATLLAMQRLEPALARKNEPTPDMTVPTDVVATFSVPELGAMPLFQNLDPSTLHDRVKELEQAWMIEPWGKKGPRKLWRLTMWGRSYHHGSLATHINRHLAHTKDRPTSVPLSPTSKAVGSQQLQATSTTIGDSLMEPSSK